MDTQIPKTNQSEDRSELGALYPVPKTIEERFADQAARDKRREAKRPRFAPIAVAAITSAVLAIIHLIGLIAPGIPSLGALLAPIAAIMILLVLAFIIWRSTGTIISIYYRSGVSSRVFFITYAVMMAADFTIATRNFEWAANNWLAFSVINILAHFIAVSLVAAITLPQRQTTD